MDDETQRLADESDANEIYRLLGRLSQELAHLYLALREMDRTLRWQTKAPVDTDDETSFDDLIELVNSPMVEAAVHDALLDVLATAETVAARARTMVETPWQRDDERRWISATVLKDAPDLVQGLDRDELTTVTREVQRAHYRVRATGGAFAEVTWVSSLSLALLRDEFRANRDGSFTAFSELDEADRTPYEQEPSDS